MILNCPNTLENRKKDWHVFLGGAITGAPDWQHSMPEKEGIVWICPRMTKYEGVIEPQVNWENEYMRSSDIILFWIPEPLEDFNLADSYAKTTRTEFGEYLAKGKKIIFGCYSGFPGEKYFEQKLKQYNQNEVYHSLEDCIKAIEKYIFFCNLNTKKYYTSDTHFGSLRVLELSRRPFINIYEMDWNLIEKWNNKVHPYDVVYHLGDFGNTEMLKWLNGYIFFITGNYERDNYSKIPKDIERVKCEGNYLVTSKYILVHEPSRGIAMKVPIGNLPVLYGHIHGIQKMKNWIGLDVGVDANHFMPISEEDVDFYINNMKKGYYNEEVWT